MSLTTVKKGFKKQQNSSIFNRLKISNNIYNISGAKFYLPNFPLDFIQRCIVCRRGFFEETILKELDKFLPRDAVIFDIGANIGNHTLFWLLASNKNVQKVYSFEPVKSTFQILQRNIELNNLEDKTEIFNFGLSDESTSAYIGSFAPSNIGAAVIKKGMGNILLKKLDELAFDINKIDLIKIDVEGHELEVLRGAKKTLDKYKPLIFVECFFKNQNALNKMLFDCGYRKIKTFHGSNYLYKYIDE